MMGSWIIIGFLTKSGFGNEAMGSPIGGTYYEKGQKNELTWGLR
jgi:hypothetical protein